MCPDLLESNMKCKNRVTARELTICACYVSEFVHK